MAELVLGTLYATEIVPVLLLGAFAGVYVDRLNRRHLLLEADLLWATLVALIPLLSLMGLLHIWELYALAFSLALLSLASDIATTAELPALAQSENTRANAAYQFIMQAAEFAGPVLGGLAIAALGAVHALWLDALSFGRTFVVIWRVPSFSEQGSSSRGRHIVSKLREGLHWLRKEPVLKWIGLQAMLGNLGLGIVSAVLLYYLHARLGLPAQLAEVEYAMVGVGGLLGSLLIVPLTHLLRRGTLYPALLLCGLLGRASIVVLPWWWVPGVSLGLVAACDTAWIILSTSVRQERIPAPLMGRVLSFSRLLSTAAMPLGAVMGGLLAQTYDARLVFGIAALTKGGEVLIARFPAIHRL